MSCNGRPPAAVLPIAIRKTHEMLTIPVAAWATAKRRHARLVAEPRFGRRDAPIPRAVAAPERMTSRTWVTMGTFSVGRPSPSASPFAHTRNRPSRTVEVAKTVISHGVAVERLDWGPRVASASGDAISRVGRQAQRLGAAAEADGPGKSLWYSCTAGFIRSLSPLPVRMQTALKEGPMAPERTWVRRAAIPAAEAGSQKTPSISTTLW